MPGNDLLSHGETPHYHRRSSISLLSSEWDQVGLERYGCQANWLENWGLINWGQSFGSDPN